MRKPVCSNNQVFHIIPFLLLLAAAVCGRQGSTTPSETFTQSWKAVDSLFNLGLTQSALDTVAHIYAAARAEGNSEQMVKALMHRMRFVEYREEDAFVKSITYLTAEITAAPFPAKAILESMLAECYGHYYRNNRRRFYDRSTVDDSAPGNIHTWDLRTIMEHTAKAYMNSLNGRDKLKQIRLDTFGAEIINHGTTMALRPTLYDLLVHRAVDFFSMDDNELTKPASTFTLDRPDYFAPFDRFAKITITSRDTVSLKYLALRLLQELIVFHATDTSPEALIDADLKRLDFVRQRSAPENRDSLYLRALQTLADRFRTHSASAEVNYRIALLYRDRARLWVPHTDDRYRWMNREAIEWCEKSIGAFPRSYGAQQCRSLMSSLRTKQLSIKIESVNLPDMPFKALLTYRNVRKVYLRQIPITVEAYRNLIDGGYSLERIAIKLSLIKPLRRLSIDLPDAGDLREHSVEIPLPALPCGHYVILCSTEQAISCTKQSTMWMSTGISRISYLSRRTPQGGEELYLLDRLTGAPLPKAGVTLINVHRNPKTGREERINDGTCTSDNEGHVLVPPEGEGYSFKCTNGSDSLGGHWFRLGFSDWEKPVPPRWRPRTYFFTDRAIYRPGQTIYFKGIMLSTNWEASDIAANRATTVGLYNANDQEVAHLDLTSNSYGSVHGSFTAPVNALGGRMYLSDGNGTHYFSVEEYKRPKFTVGVVPFEGVKRPGDSVLVTGRAVSYTGAAVDGAQVRYSIVRTARFPDYWWCWWRPSHWSSSVKIGSGRTVTNDTGGFAIGFVALTDKSIPKTENPVFSYKVSVDVTDINGETRSTTETVNVGYAALTLSMDIPEKVNKGTPLTVPLSTTNCNGVFTPAFGAVTIHRLTAPKNVLRGRLWDRPDTTIPDEAAFRRSLPGDPYGNETDFTTWKREKKVFESLFDTKKNRTLTLGDIGRWKQGVYVAEATATDPWGIDVKEIRYFTLYSERGKKLPFPQPDWFIPVNDHGEPGETAKFLIGSGYKNVVILYEIQHRRNIVKKEWLSVNNSQTLVEIPIKESYRGNFSAHFSFIHDNRTYQHVATVTVPWSNKKLDISFETFRDHLLPGEKEQWKIRIAGNNTDKIAAEMVATLYDASLDAFNPHDWQFDLYPTYSTEFRWEADKSFSTGKSLDCSRYWNEITNPPPDLSYPSLNWFGYSFGRGYSLAKREIVQSGSGGYIVQKISQESSGEYNLDEELQTLAQIREEQERVFEPGSFTSGGASWPSSAPDFEDITARSNLTETAFFYPLLTTDENGTIIANFTIPETLTRWNMLGFAHTKDLRYGRITASLVTRKALMVVPNPPRFFRENDLITFTAKVSNLSDDALNGTAQLFLFDAASMQPVDSLFKNRVVPVSFSVKKGGSAPLAWRLSVPEGIGAVTCRVVAKAKNFTDGEEQTLPVLSNRMLVTESMPLSIRKKETKRFTLKNLVTCNGGSATLRNHRLTLEFTVNPAWYAIQALPYLIEYPYECAEQMFSRLYANSIASHIVNSSPRIRAVFDQWRTLSPDALLSNLEKNPELKSLALEETPWLLDGKNESERKQRIALLFDLNAMADEKVSAFEKLRKMQSSNGGWPWFEGMQDDRYITQYIITGIGRLDHLGVVMISDDERLGGMVDHALRYLDKRIREDYEWLVRANLLGGDNLSELHIQYLYMRSFFSNTPIAEDCRAAVDYFMDQAKKHWLTKSRYLQGMIALALNRTGERAVPKHIIRSLRENALVSEETGMYWKEMCEGYSWWWYEAPVESQALMIEAFEEVARDSAAVEDLKARLLKSKQTRHWPTTRSTAEACYALLLRGVTMLEQPSEVVIRLGDTLIDPIRRKDISAEAGTGYFKLAWSEHEITPSMGDVSVTKAQSGVAWGGLYWQYFEQLDKIKSHETPLRLDKKLFLQQNSPTGQKITPVTSTTLLSPGDRLTVRIELRVDRDMEYVHMKDMRASGFEPLNVFSGYRWQDGLEYYVSTRDAATSFFFSSLCKGTYVFEYPLVVSHAGDFSNGITTIRCMYAPEFASHSEGVRVKVGK